MQTEVTFIKQIEKYTREEILSVPKISKKRAHHIFQLFARYFANAWTPETGKSDVDFLMNKHDVTNLANLQVNGQSLTMITRADQSLFLLDNYIPYDFTDDRGNNVLFYASIELLKKIDFDKHNLLYHKNNEGQNALFYIAIKNNVGGLKRIKFLQNKGMDIRGHDKKGLNIIDHILLIDKWQLDRNKKQLFIKEIVKMGCFVSEIKEKNRMPANWYDEFIIEEVKIQKEILNNAFSAGTLPSKTIKRI